MKHFIAVASALAAVATFAETPKAKPADAKPADAKKFAITGDAAKGQAQFKTYCAACHGDQGKGDGPAAAALNPKPANFSDAAHAATVTDEYIYNMIKEGGLANGKSSLMAGWKSSLNESQLMDVAAFVRSLSKTAAPAADKKPAPKK
jgi:mono/diheme cytochrome c family protein